MSGHEWTDPVTLRRMGAYGTPLDVVPPLRFLPEGGEPQVATKGPLGDLLVREILRLAGENAKLKAALKSAALLTDEITKENEAIQSKESARIRRELLLAVHEQRETALRREQVGNPVAAVQLFAEIIDALDRIVPGEG